MHQQFRWTKCWK